MSIRQLSFFAVVTLIVCANAGAQVVMQLGDNDSYLGVLYTWDRRRLACMSPERPIRHFAGETPAVPVEEHVPQIGTAFKLHPYPPQKALPKKPYDQWGRDEVTKILFDSPWARFPFDRPAPREYQVHVRLHSALPVRQALVRRMQLTIPYKKLTAAQKTSFDAEVDGLLNCRPCLNYYVVTLSSGRPDPLQQVTGRDPLPEGMRPEPRVVDVIEILKRVPQDELLRQVWLANDAGERRAAEKLTFSRDNEVVFLFPRFDDQRKPLITAANKKFYFELDEKLFRKEARPLRRFTFEVAPLISDQEVIF